MSTMSTIHLVSHMPYRLYIHIYLNPEGKGPIFASSRTVLLRSGKYVIVAGVWVRAGARWAKSGGKRLILDSILAEL